MPQVPYNVYYVCENFNNNIPHHEFGSIQDALNQIQDYGKAKIVILSDFLDIPELVMTHNYTSITIDGGDRFGITFLGPMIVKLSEDQSLEFRNLTHIYGEGIGLAEDGSSFGVYNTQSIVAHFELVPDKRYTDIRIHDSKFYGSHGNPVINVTNIETGIEIFNSYIEGSFKNPAIYFRVAANKKLKMKNSVIQHGSEGNPIQVSPGLFVDVYIYNCFGKEKIVNNPINNLIVINNNNISDENILF